MKSTARPDGSVHGYAVPGHVAVAGESSYEYYRRIYRDAPYFSSGRSWSDYAPAYRYAMEQTELLGIDAASFDAIEPRLRVGWERARDGSRLSWPEARGAVRHVFEDAAAQRRACTPNRES